MIPKIIHYCWFGEQEKPDKVKRCINSWKQILSDYTFIEWNETNFNIQNLKYTRDAYQSKKFAFVSDVARVKALQLMGGIYLDTDVEVFKRFDDLLENRCILGFEEENYIATSFIAAEPNHPLISQFVELYESLPFYDIQGNIITGTNVEKLTKMLCDMGLERNNILQRLDEGLIIYPKEYFSPYVYTYGVYNITKESYCVHHFFVSWMPPITRMKLKIKKLVVKMIGLNNAKRIRRRLKGNK